MKRSGGPPAFEIALYWIERKPLWVLDIGEPSCFRCGHYEEAWDLKDATPINCRARWTRATSHERSREIPLERAHIVAHGDGGENTPSNLVMLCAKCHPLAPMTCSFKIMEAWIDARGQSPRDKFLGDVVVEAKKLGPMPENILGYDPSVIRAFARTLGVGLHSGRMSPSTVAAIIASLGRAQTSGLLPTPPNETHPGWFKQTPLDPGDEPDRGTVEDDRLSP